MATFYALFPNEDVKSDWTEVPTGSPSDRLVSESRADWIETTANGAVCRVGFSNPELAATGETVVNLRIAVDLIAFGTDIELGILMSGTVIRRMIVPSATNGVVQLEVSGAHFTQAQRDSLQFQCIHRPGLPGAGTSIVYSAIGTLVTRFDIWESVDAKVRFNRHTTTGLSIAGGTGTYLGSDCGPSVDLGGGRSFGYGGDAAIPSAAGQQFWLGTNAASPSAPASAFCRNIGYLWDNYNLEVANWTVHTGPSGAPFHPDDSVLGGRWPIQSFRRAGRLFTVGLFPDAPELGWIAYTDSNLANSPSTWTWTYAPPIRVASADVPNGRWCIWDDGANYVYMWSGGANTSGSTDNTWNTISLCRVNVSKFQNVQWAHPEWWTGHSWARDRGALNSPLPSVVQRVRGRSRGRLLKAPLTEAMQGQGSMHKRPGDGLFQMTFMDGVFFVPAPLKLKYFKTPGPSPGTYPGGAAPSVGYTVAEGENFAYAASNHPQLTWPGKGPQDQVWSYATNWFDAGRTWEPMYYIHFVKVLNVV